MNFARWDPEHEHRVLQDQRASEYQEYKGMILVHPISATQIRMVLHLDITEEMVKETLSVINQL